MDATEKKIIDLIDSHRDELISFARDIYTHAELGYKEFHTSRKFENAMKRLGLEVQDGLAITGVKAYLNQEKKENISLALIGELDALRIPNQKYANPETNAAHCCGHHCQLTGVLGAAIALSDPEVAKELDGQVVFFAVPAEEYGDVEFKSQLKADGKIKYGGGKCELIRIGAFDDIQLSIVHHSTKGDKISFNEGPRGTGFVSKTIRYKGKAAHAGSVPHRGINALNAASLGLSALAYQRETFQDPDHVRVHPIITKGGDQVNVIPDEVVIEMLVRAANQEAIMDASAKTDRAFFAGGAAVGATVEIETMPGYLPGIQEKANPELFEAAKLASGGKYAVEIEPVNPRKVPGSSSDVGDLQHIQPALSFHTGGATGAFHSSEFDIADEELAYIVTAKVFALGAYRILKNQAQAAKKTVAEYHPVFTKEEYVKFMDSMIKTEIRNP